MNHIAVVYWSGTGNTEQMAQAVLEGAKENGASSECFSADKFDGTMMDNYDRIAFGCPAMGAEELEESEFQPMFESCRPKLEGKRIALFGSYGWGDGEWMRNWENLCKADGALLVSESVICNDAPDEDILLACKELGKQLSGL